MIEITLLTDYKGYFGSKNNAKPYRSGMALERLVELFKKKGFVLKPMHFSAVNFRSDWSEKIVLYTSQEDGDGLYKDYIEDIINGLEFSGARVIPDFRYLRSHNNKVFMEILRDNLGIDGVKNLRSRYYGTIEEALTDQDALKYPCVVKRADGAMSTGVKLAKSPKELPVAIKSLCKTSSLYFEFKELVRTKIHSGYKRESSVRRKFIIQEFVAGLENDWKVLIFGNRYYVFKRKTRDNDFRASGSGHDGYLYGSKAELPDGILRYASDIQEALDTPCLSLDIAFSNNQFYLLEFQALYFGTVGQWRSDCYYQLEQSTGDFNQIFDSLDLEEAYADAIVSYLEKK